jgi:hypothetical protein
MATLENTRVARRPQAGRIIPQNLSKEPQGVKGNGTATFQGENDCAAAGRESAAPMAAWWDMSPEGVNESAR